VVWRGIAARRLISLTIFALTVLVVSGTLVSVSFGRLTGVSRGSAGGLVLLGFVALAAQSMESVRRREGEIALARLRGRHGPRLLGFAIAEPCLVVVAGAAAGAVAGWLVTRMVVSAWLPASTRMGLGADEWTAVALVTIGSLLLVAASSWQIIRAPLLGQLVGARRPVGTTTLELFLQLLLVLGAVVSIYQANRASGARVDWVTLISPAVVGLAGGQLVSWLLIALLAAAVPRNRNATVGWFLTLRRLLRRADSLALVRIVVAAGVVFGVAASASVAAHQWRDDRARLQVGGPVSYPVPAGALRAYAAATSADPQGHWLLPVVADVESADGSARRVFVGADRWRAVVGDFFDATPSAPLTGRVAALAGPGPRIETGDEVSATVVTRSLIGTRGLHLTVQYVDDQGDTTPVSLALRPGHGTPAGLGLTRFSRHVTDCHAACTVIEVDIRGLTETLRQTRPPLHLVNLTFAGLRLLDESTGMRLNAGRNGLAVTREGGTLLVTASARYVFHTSFLGSFRSTNVQPAVSTGGFAPNTHQGHPSVLGIDGMARPVTYVATVPVLPFTGTQGTLLDLGRMLVGSGGSIPETQAAVVARSDTPAAVIAALRATHAVGPPTTYQRVVHRLERTAEAQGTRLYLLVAIFAALIALVSIASALAQQTRERRVEAASLRSVGVRPSQVSGAYGREGALLAGATFVGTTLTAWVACRALLPALPLVPDVAFVPAMDATPRIPLLTLSAVVAGVVVGLLTYLTFRRLGRGSPPRILREEPS
jgi:FtsX-like permease family